MPIFWLYCLLLAGMSSVVRGCNYLGFPTPGCYNINFLSVPSQVCVCNTTDYCNSAVFAPHVVAGPGEWLTDNGADRLVNIRLERHLATLIAVIVTILLQ